MRKALIVLALLLGCFLAGYLTTRYDPRLVVGLVGLAGAAVVVAWLVDDSGRHLSLRYRLYIRYSPLWQWRRWRCLRRAGGRCEVIIWEAESSTRFSKRRCENRATHAHHKTYIRLFHERPEDLQALCRRHHEGIHDKEHGR